MKVKKISFAAIAVLFGASAVNADEIRPEIQEMLPDIIADIPLDIEANIVDDGGWTER